MDFFDFSKEARIKEEARIKALENNVINKATKMALDKFSKVYGGTTQVIAKTANLREFKRNYLSGKIASELCISTKQGTKNIPFTILVKASEPSILESDQIILEKVASTEGSLDAEINSIISKQEQKLVNLEAEEQNNKRILADLAKGVSIEAARKAHIFKEAKKQKKQERNSLSTATTPTDFLGDVVEYFTYPKTFFPAMKVGAIIDIAGVKYKYIGDEATMTEPAGNTNGTIARFELANKKKASLKVKAEDTDSFKYIYSLYENGKIDEFKQKIDSWFPNQLHKFEYFLDYLEDNVGLTSEQAEAVLSGKAMPKKESTEVDIEKTADDETPEIELTDELLNTSVKQYREQGKSIYPVFRQIGRETGYEGKHGALSLFQSWKGDKNTVTFRDIYEKAKGRYEQSQKENSGEAKRSKGRPHGSKEEVLTPKLKEQDKQFEKEDAFFSDDEKVLEDIGDAENIEDAGYNLKGNDDLYYLDTRFWANNGLPENRVNDILVDIICSDPDRAFAALNTIVFPEGGRGYRRDPHSIADKYKKQLLESVISKYSLDRLYANKFPKRFIDKYVDLEAVEEKIDYTPFTEGKFDFSVVEAFMDTRPSSEDFKKYVEEHDILNNIDKEIQRYQDALAKIEAEEAKEKDNNSEEDK